MWQPIKDIPDHIKQGEYFLARWGGVFNSTAHFEVIYE